MEFLNNSPLMGTAISAVTLGLTGILVRAFLGVAKDLVTGSKVLKEQINIAERLNVLEGMIYDNAMAHKASVLGSSLLGEDKAAVLVHTTKVEEGHLKYAELKKAADIAKAEDEAEVSQVEALLATFNTDLTQVKDFSLNESSDMLAKLRGQLGAEQGEDLLGAALDKLKETGTDFLSNAVKSVATGATDFINDKAGQVEEKL